MRYQFNFSTGGESGANIENAKRQSSLGASKPPASADAVIALDGEGGTLSEIGLALKLGRPVVAINAWREISQIRRAIDPAAAIELALQLAR